MNDGWVEVTYWCLGTNEVIWRSRVPPTYEVPSRGDVADFGRQGRWLVERREWREAVEVDSVQGRHVLVWCARIAEGV